jgi:hypothetical protein
MHGELDSEAKPSALAAFESLHPLAFVFALLALTFCLLANFGSSRQGYMEQRQPHAFTGGVRFGFPLVMYDGGTEYAVSQTGAISIRDVGGVRWLAVGANLLLGLVCIGVAGLGGQMLGERFLNRVSVNAGLHALPTASAALVFLVVSGAFLAANLTQSHTRRELETGLLVELRQGFPFTMYLLRKHTVAVADLDPAIEITSEQREKGWVTQWYSHWYTGHVVWNICLGGAVSIMALLSMQALGLSLRERRAPVGSDPP